MDRSRQRDLAILIIAFLASIAISAALGLMGHALWPSEPLHSAIEAFGAFEAVTLGGIMLLFRGRKGSALGNAWVAAGLLSMGALDVFHASVRPGAAFVWLRSWSSLFGGLFFSLVWIEAAGASMRRAVPASAAVFATIFGVFSIVFAGGLPLMSVKGEFTALSVGINMAAGLLFLAAMPKFFVSWWRHGTRDDFLFALICLLFGASGLLFRFSQLWDPGWWYWHFLRLAAYVIVLSYSLLIYRRFIVGITEAVSGISSTAAEIAAAVEEHERTASAQAASVAETTAAMDELSSNAARSREQAKSASSGAEEALKISREGVDTANKALSIMEGLRERVNAIADRTTDLSERIGQISGISSLVADIASQINMLALNAAVEAVRAGEAGRGFGIIAQEVRKLADEGRKAAERVNSISSEIWKSAASTVAATELGAKAARDGAALMKRDSDAFKAVDSSVADAYERVGQILLNTVQQAEAVEQVLKAMNAINSGARETAAGLKQTRGGVENLNGASKRLLDIT